MQDPDQISIPEVIEMLQELSAQRRAIASEASAQSLPPNAPRVCIHNRPWESWCLECYNEQVDRIFKRILNLEDHLDFALRCLLEITRRAGTPVDLRDSIQQHLDDLHKGIDDA